MCVSPITHNCTCSSGNYFPSRSVFASPFTPPPLSPKTKKQQSARIPVRPYAMPPVLARLQSPADPAPSQRSTQNRGLPLSISIAPTSSQAASESSRSFKVSPMTISPASEDILEWLKAIDEHNEQAKSLYELLANRLVHGKLSSVEVPKVVACKRLSSL